MKNRVASGHAPSFKALRKSLALVLIALLLTGCSSGGGAATAREASTWETPIKRLAAYYNGDYRNMSYAESSDIFMDYFAEEEFAKLRQAASKSYKYVNAVEKLEKIRADFPNSLKEEYGDDYRVSFEVVSREKMSDNALENWETTFNNLLFPMLRQHAECRQREIPQILQRSLGL